MNTIKCVLAAVALAGTAIVFAAAPQALAAGPGAIGSSASFLGGQSGNTDLTVGRDFFYALSPANKTLD